MWLLPSFPSPQKNTHPPAQKNWLNMTPSCVPWHPSACIRISSIPFSQSCTLRPSKVELRPALLVDKKKHGWMVYVSSHFFLVRLVGGGWWLGWFVLGWLGWLVLGCLCKQVTWLVAYLYPTQKQQPFGNCFGFHWVKMAWILMSSAGRFWKKHLQRKHTPPGFNSLPLAP